MGKSRLDYSFGVIPVRYNKTQQWEVFLIQHRYGLHWSFPKGHAERKEEPLETAYRELNEETGLKPAKVLSNEPLTETYWFFSKGQRILKKVSYFLIQVEGKIKLDLEELIAGKWVLLEEAQDHLTHAESKCLIRQVVDILITVQT